jgi:signal transduction histidine kinase
MPAAGPAEPDGEPLYRVLAGLALRDLTLVESLLQVVEKLESREEDAGQLELLFRIDHLATRMRRNSENLLVLAGHDGEGRDLEPVPLLDVVRAAISEITEYSRAQISSLPDVTVIGPAADDVSHILAELLDNATSKSPESAAVVVRAERTGDGTMVVSVGRPRNPRPRASPRRGHA